MKHLKVNLSQGMIVLALCAGCASMRDSLILGAVSGGAVGAYTGSLAYGGPNSKLAHRNIGIGAATGIGIGLLSAYLLHNSVENRVEAVEHSLSERVYYGDLPPNPFDVKMAPPAKGGN